VTDLIDTTEMYLKAIYELEEEGLNPMRVRIAERLEHSGPTVSQTVARMERDGLLRLTDDRSLEFTDEGRLTAIEVMRKHRLAERFLLEVIGLPWEKIHDEACRWEHVMSEEVERKLVELISEPGISPFGMPVPGLELLGLPIRETVACSPLTELADGNYTLCRIGEPLQVDSQFLSQLRDLELLPGQAVLVSKNNQNWFVSNQSVQEGLVVDNLVAQHLFLSELPQN